MQSCGLDAEACFLILGTSFPGGADTGQNEAITPVRLEGKHSNYKASIVTVYKLNARLQTSALHHLISVIAPKKRWYHHAHSAEGQELRFRETCPRACTVESRESWRVEPRSL